MKRLSFLILVAAAACGTPSVIAPDVTELDAGEVDGGSLGGGGGGGGGGGSGSDAGVGDGGTSLDGGVLPDRVIRPLYFSTADQPMPSQALAQLNTLWAAMNARFREENRLSLELAPAIEHRSSKTCAQLGADSNAIINTIRIELAPDGNSKFQVIVPCDDPSGAAAGVAYIGGTVGITFDGSKRLGGSANQGYLTAVAMHELGHNLGLQHNSVGNNCMGPVELRSFALGLLGDTETAACVFLPHQRATMLQTAPSFLIADAGSAFSGAAPGVAPTASKLSGSWQVYLSWLGALPSGAAGWHIERDGKRILRVRLQSSDTDSDGAAEYHNDPAMTDPGLVNGGRYCYRLRAYDAAGTDGPPGAEACVDL